MRPLTRSFFCACAVTKAKTLLGWEPQVQLREGLSLMVSDFRARLLGDERPGAKRPEPDAVATVGGKKIKIVPATTHATH